MSRSIVVVSTTGCGRRSPARPASPKSPSQPHLEPLSWSSWFPDVVAFVLFILPVSEPLEPLELLPIPLDVGGGLVVSFPVMPLVVPVELLPVLPAVVPVPALVPPAPIIEPVEPVWAVAVPVVAKPNNVTADISLNNFALVLLFINSAPFIFPIFSVRLTNRVYPERTRRFAG